VRADVRATLPLTPTNEKDYAGAVEFSRKIRWFRWVVLWWLAPTAWAGSQLIHVASYNVENYLDAPSGTRHAKTPAAQAKVCQSILALKPDVIALQEIGSTNALLELQARLRAGGLDLQFWDWVAGHDTNIHVAVLSRFPIVARQAHTNDSFLLEGRRLEVSRGFAEVEIQPNPRFTFTLIAAHLKSRRATAVADEEEWRYEEALALRELIDTRLGQNPGQDMIVLGDFNDIKDSKPIRALMGRGRSRLFDTRPAERNGDDPALSSESHESRRVTWTHYYGVEDVYSRIDYILLSPDMRKYWVAGETYILALPNWGMASDHRPVMAGFAVPGP
jgi:endonuclease/exonuclease/phosphatase family metal-dependent hydrolase